MRSISRKESHISDLKLITPSLDNQTLVDSALVNGLFILYNFGGSFKKKFRFIWQNPKPKLKDHSDHLLQQQIS